jgi:hypothetical protein
MAQSDPHSAAGDNRPVHTLRHRSLKAAIWRNQTDKGPMFNVTFVRSFRNDAEEWQDSQGLLVLANCVIALDKR